MNVLIEIDEKDYQNIVNDNIRNLVWAERLIKNGTPLPHGICGVIANGEPLPDDVKEVNK